MSQQHWNSAPQYQGGYQQQWTGVQPQPPKQPNNTVWWVVIGITSLVLIGIIAYALLGGGDSTDPEPPVQPQSTAPQDPGGDDGTDEGGDDGTDLGGIGVASATMPERIGNFQKVSEETYEGMGILAQYDGSETLYATVTFGTADYEAILAELLSRQTIGLAECGFEEPLGSVDDGGGVPVPHPSCYILASDGFVGLSGSSIDLAELSALTEELVRNL